VDIEDTNINEISEEEPAAPPQDTVETEPEAPQDAPAEPEPPAEVEAPPESEPQEAEVVSEPVEAEAAPRPAPIEPAPESGVCYGTGHRKDATARVWLRRGSGSFTVNKMPVANYLRRRSLEIMVVQPLVATDLEGRVDVDARVKGGGIAGQAGALRHGIARALLEMDPGLRPVLRRAGFLTRDPRVKERKKYGLRRARRAFQFTKR
jgi:small subunit ribosomal protein S9